MFLVKCCHLYELLKQRCQKEIAKVSKFGEQESVRILTGKCMEQWEHNVETDIWGLDKYSFFGLKWRTLLVLDNPTTLRQVK